MMVSINNFVTMASKYDSMCGGRMLATVRVARLCFIGEQLGTFQAVDC